MSYRLIDSGDFRKLEDVGGSLVVRPAAAALWPPSKKWSEIDLEFHRLRDGSGRWDKRKKIDWPKTVEISNLKFNVEPTSFGHLGIFPEHSFYWDRLPHLIRSSPKPVEILNLFAYTGGASLACAKAGAHVVHVDASKPSVQWAKENAHLNELPKESIRWIVDDVTQFVKREVRRERMYHGLILDPPSYGRGPSNEVWKIEEHLFPLLKEAVQILDPELNFVLLTSHSQGHSPIALENLLKSVFPKSESYSHELLMLSTSGFSLPSGSAALSWRGFTYDPTKSL